jgi:hypothetical protein
MLRNSRLRPAATCIRTDSFTNRTCLRRLSLSQRERTKVRDCLAAALEVRSKLLATRCRAPGEPDDSKISIQRLRGEPGVPTAFDHEFGLHDSYVHRRPIRSPALRWDNKNLRHNRGTDVGDETCSLRNFGSVSVAKEYVQAHSPFFAAIERDPQRFILTINVSFEKPFAHPLISILSPQSGARRRTLLPNSFDPF